MRYRSGKKWKTWREGTKKLSGTFGKRKPKVTDGALVPVRGALAPGRKHRSDWSPELVVDR